MTANIAVKAPPPDLRLLKLRPAGMFSNVNEVVEQLRLAEAGHYRFVIDWTASAYRDPDMPGDPWGYYFHPCFEHETLAAQDAGGAHSMLPVLPGGGPVACTRDNIITPREIDGQCAPLLLPKDRSAAHRLIVNHLALKASVVQAIDSFTSRHFNEEIIGLHIRGPGRTDGGVPALRQRYGSKEDVPLAPFFAAIDRVTLHKPAARIFAASGSSVVMDAIKTHYGDRVISWPAQRSPFGEMHANHPENSGMTFSKHGLGLDVICEAYLLARTDHLIHGNSNVANFILCLNPELSHDYVLA